LENVDRYLWPFGNFLQTLGIFYDHLMIHFVFIWYIFPGLVWCNKKNVATLLCTEEKAVFYFNTFLTNRSSEPKQKWFGKLEHVPSLIFVQRNRILLGDTKFGRTTRHKIWSDGTKFGRMTQIMCKIRAMCT
jgi:hypothetical protein